jgi:hypothetical protein
MPFYFLDVVTPANHFEDPEGGEYDGLQGARAEALASARQIMIDNIRSGRALGLKGRIEIRDEQRSLLESVFFAKAISLED